MVLITFLIYLAVLIIVGIITYRYNETLADFVLAGRRLGVWVTAISAKASDMSGWLLLGVPGKAFTLGFGAIWIGIACTLGTLFNWTFLAGRLRRYTEYLQALTLPDFFEARFKDEHTRIVRLLSAFILVIFMILYVSSQFSASKKALVATFNLDPLVALILGASVIMFYTMMGGFFAVAWTDLFQGLLMVFALIILPIVGLFRIGGFQEMLGAMQKVGGSHLTLTGGTSDFALVTFILGFLAIGLGYPGQPHILTRYMAIRDPNKIRQATIISMTWVILSLTGAILIGFVAHSILGEVNDPEKVLPMLALRILPSWLAGILIAAAMAAIMSTADSQLLVATSTIVEDFYRKFLNRDVPQENLVLYSRLVTLVLGLIALSLLLSDKVSSIVFELVLYAWGGLAASFGPAVIMSLWWKRTTKWGIVAGMTTGAVTIIIWYNVEYLKTWIYELFPGFFFSLLAIIIVSMFTKPPREVQTEFDTVLKIPKVSNGKNHGLKSQMDIVIDFLQDGGSPAA